MPAEASLPIETLPHFVDEIEKLLENIVEDCSLLLFAEDIQEHLHNAWHEVKDTVSFIRSAIAGPINSTILERAGPAKVDSTPKTILLRQSFGRRKPAACSGGLMAWNIVIV